MQSDTLHQSLLTSFTGFATLVYSLTVRDLRTEHRSASLGVLLSVAQPIAAGVMFYVITLFLGARAAPVRGDDLTFIVLGFMIFFFHVRTASAVAGAIRKDMMNHQKATPFLFICIKAYGALYKNIFAIGIMFVLNYLLRDKWEMDDGLIFGLVVLLCWFGGVGVGVIFLAMNQYLSAGQIIQATFFRVMFFTSGKFFVANSAPSAMRDLMDWNPLFHLLDQARGALFINYTARTTDLVYATSIYFAIIVLAFLLEAHVRRNYSLSKLPG